MASTPSADLEDLNQSLKALQCDVDLDDLLSVLYQYKYNREVHLKVDLHVDVTVATKIEVRVEVKLYADV